MTARLRLCAYFGIQFRPPHAAHKIWVSADCHKPAENMETERNCLYASSGAWAFRNRKPTNRHSRHYFLFRVMTSLSQNWQVLGMNIGSRQAIQRSISYIYPRKIIGVQHVDARLLAPASYRGRWPLLCTVHRKVCFSRTGHV